MPSQISTLRDDPPPPIPPTPYNIPILVFELLVITIFVLVICLLATLLSQSDDQ